MKTAIIALIVAMSPWHGDIETSDERAVRVETIVEAAQWASSKVDWQGEEKELTAALLSLAWHETRFARHIHEGNCRPEECDGGKAVGLWQIHALGGVTQPIWEQMKGSDQQSTRLAALWAAKFLSRGRNRCKNLEGAFAMYATGQRCTWPDAIKRVRLTRKILSRTR